MNQNQLMPEDIAVVWACDIQNHGGIKWTYHDLATRGTPVCKWCHEDMVMSELVVIESLD